jgi:hypothetical protein
MWSLFGTILLIAIAAALFIPTLFVPVPISRLDLLVPNMEHITIETEHGGVRIGH